MSKTISLNGTEIAITLEALDWLLRTDKTLVGQDKTRVKRLYRRLKGNPDAGLDGSVDTDAQDNRSHDVSDYRRIYDHLSFGRQK